MKNIAEKIQFVKDFLAGLPKINGNDPITIEDVKYGVVDTFLLSRAKSDANNVYANAKLITNSFNSIKEFIDFAKKNFQSHAFSNKTLIAYRPLSNKYHFQMVKIFNVKKAEDWDKYLILM